MALVVRETLLAAGIDAPDLDRMDLDRMDLDRMDLDRTAASVTTPDGSPQSYGRHPTRPGHLRHRNPVVKHEPEPHRVREVALLQLAFRRAFWSSKYTLTSGGASGTRSRHSCLQSGGTAVAATSVTPS
jgi:hypothetical protein